MEAPKIVQEDCAYEQAEQLHSSHDPENVSHQPDCSSNDCPPASTSSVEDSDVGSQSDQSAFSFVNAVNEKYSFDSDTPLEVGIGSLYLPKKWPVKLTESGTILLPRQVSMTGYNISKAGDCKTIQCMCLKVEDLDLMSNNIQSWGEVFSILEGTPHLTFLNLSQNKMASSSFPDLSGRNLPNLTRLVLNDTNVSWNIVHRLLEAFPQIEELHLSVNDYHSFDILTSLSPYTALRSLFFVGNKITDWREMNKIGTFFPGLECLMLSETNLAQLTGVEDIPTSFPSLKILSLNRTCLSSWYEVEKLRNFPQLVDVRLLLIPFLEEQPKDILRNHTVALLPKVVLLNQTPISEDERENAERAYIRLYMDKEQKSARFAELEKIHGKLKPLCPLEMKPKMSVKVIVKVEELEEDDNDLTRDPLFVKEMELELDVKMQMKDLRKMLSNIAHHPASKLKLYHINRFDGKEDAIRMIYSNRTILGYNMHDGDEVIAAKFP